MIPKKVLGHHSDTPIEYCLHDKWYLHNRGIGLARYIVIHHCGDESTIEFAAHMLGVGHYNRTGVMICYSCKEEFPKDIAAIQSLLLFPFMG